MNDLINIIIDTWRFFRANVWGIWKVLFPIIVPISLLIAILSEYTQTGGGVSWILFGVMILLYPIIQGAEIFYISSIITGDTNPRNVYYRLALKFWVPLFGLYVISSLAVFIGLILLIIPGFIVLARLMFSQFYCLLQEKSSIEAFNSSWVQTKDYQWLLLFGMIFLAVVSSIPVWLLQKGVVFLGIESVIFVFIFNLIEFILGTIITIFGFRVFSLHIGQVNGHSQQG